MLFLVMLYAGILLTSATAKLAATPACGPYSLIHNEGLVNSATLLKQVPAANITECCSACTGTDTCAAFTFSPVRGTCRLTATPHEHGPVPNVTSGTIINNTNCIPVKRPLPPVPSSVPIAQRPNFVTLLIDDLGYDDLRSHDLYPNASAFTPNTEKLMRGGVTLGRHHSYMWCSPTRRSFLTGRYPVHITGRQASTDTNLTPLQFTILSEKLAAAEYESHFIGKGHLGWHTTDHLLVKRGFHSHVGYLGGSQSYVCGVQDHSGRAGCDPHVGRHDMWHNNTPGVDIVPQIQYSTNFYTKYAIERIQRRNKTRPLWLHVAYQAMHGGNFRDEVMPWEVLPNGTGFRDAKYGNALRALDDGIGNITGAIQEAGMWNNTLMIVVADNGGDNPGGKASNYPLLGRKCLSWEGGTRVYGFASGGLIPVSRHGSSTKQLMHISDWYTTFATLAGVDPSDDWVDPNTNLTHPIDGVNVFPALVGASGASTREWLPTTHKSILWDQTSAAGGHMWKLIQGNETQAKRFNKDGSTYDDPHNACLQPRVDLFDCVNSVGQHGGGGRRSCVVCTNERPCLFDVAQDESETRNLANDPRYASVVHTMKAKLATFAKPYVPLALTQQNLACYNCSFKPDVLWGNFSGPGCIARV